MADQHATTPTKADLLKLPRWARVAFAARCARRVQQPVPASEGMRAEHVHPVEKAIALAEASARAGRPEASLLDAYEHAFRYADAYLVINPATCAGAHFAAQAAFAAHDPEIYAKVSPKTIAHSARDIPNTRDLLLAFWSDYQALRALATAEAWDDATPVDVSRLGPF